MSFAENETAINSIEHIPEIHTPNTSLRDAGIDPVFSVMTLQIYWSQQFSSENTTMSHKAHQ